jgi:hypothetical protein
MQPPKQRMQNCRADSPNRCISELLAINEERYLLIKWPFSKFLRTEKLDLISPEVGGKNGNYPHLKEGQNFLRNEHLACLG